MPVVERADDPERFEDLVTERDDAIAKLGILGLTVDEKYLPNCRLCAQAEVC